VTVYVGVVGVAAATAEEETIAEEVGRLLAERGVVVVCGGLGGVMAAACRGAKGAGGSTIGILPGDDRSDANAWVDLAIPTGMGEARNALVVRTSDVIIAIGGEFGTLSEIALALKGGRTVVGIATWSLGRPGLTIDPILRADDAAGAVKLAMERIG
jgi:uncharacterized protein (TIGR00725 family)